MPQDEAKAFELFKRASDQGYVESTYSLGVCHETGAGVPVDLKAAHAFYMIAAERKHVLAMHNVGVSFMVGKGVEKNEKVAVCTHAFFILQRQIYEMPD